MNLKQKTSALIPRCIILRIKYLVHLSYRLKNHKNKIQTDYSIKTVQEKKSHVFFGYYDITPFNVKTDEILYLVLPQKSKEVQIVLADTSSNKKQIITTSSAWNWQQGVRLRWMPNNSREIIFNDFVNETYIARIVNVDSRTERKINTPLYDISPDGKYGLSLDFERLGCKRPGYGYTCKAYNENEHDLLNIGIDLVNLTNNSVKRLITYKQLIHLFGSHEKDAHKHYINHISFSPDGNKFLFFWLTADKPLHSASLCIYDLKTNMSVIADKDCRVSHYVWESSDAIIYTAYDDNNNCRYYRYIISTKTKSIIQSKFLQVDGHPSIQNEGLLLTDTYPDINGFQRLFITSSKNEANYQPLVSIYSTCMMEGEQRTDLHPRFNYMKNKICFDANINGYRMLNIINL